jgi:hypothetical protein
MQIRPLNLSDLKPIDDFWQKYHKNVYGIPERKFVVTDDVIVDESDSPIAYGIVRMFAEPLLYINRDVSKFQQAKAFKLLMEKAIVDCRNAGLDQINIGVKDPSFAAILKDKYQMKERESMLYLEI